MLDFLVGLSRIMVAVMAVLILMATVAVAYILTDGGRSGNAILPFIAGGAVLALFGLSVIAILLKIEEHLRHLVGGVGEPAAQGTVDRPLTEPRLTGG